MAKKYSMSYVWRDRKRIIFGLPWSFTRYALTDEKLLITTGFLNQQEDEIRLYRIMDVSLKRTFGERLFGLGTIHCCTGDKSSPELDIKRIKNSAPVKEMLSDMVEEQRNRHRVGLWESVDSGEDCEAEAPGKQK